MSDYKVPAIGTARLFTTKGSVGVKFSINVQKLFEFCENEKNLEDIEIYYSKNDDLNIIAVILPSQKMVDNEKSFDTHIIIPSQRRKEEGEKSNFKK